MNSVKYKESLYEVRDVENLRELIDGSVERFSQRPAFMVKDKTKGKFVSISYKKMQEDIRSLGTSLINLGLRGRKIAVIGENSYYWAISYFAIANGVGVVVPIDRELKEKEVANLLKRAEVSAVIYSKKMKKVMDEVLEDRELRKTLTYPIQMDLSDDEDGRISLRRLLSHGMDLLDNGDRKYLDVEVDSDALAVLLFTSGTTGLAKGVMLSHRNIVSNTVNMSKYVKIIDGGVGLSVLPMHHTYEMTCHVITGLYQGMSIAICEGLKYIQKNLVEAQVNVMLAVPLIFEMMHKKIFSKAKESGKDKTLRRMMNISRKFKLYNKGNITRRLFSNVHNVTGGKISQFIAGGAAINPQVIEDYEAMGFPIFQGYGMTECSPIIAVNKDRYSKAAAAGLPLPGTEVKIYNPDEKGIGEIICRGPSVMLGYYRDDDATREALRNGWLHTGDYGYFDQDGFLYVSGRKKSVIITKNGKNIFPEEVEFYLTESEYIEEALVHGIDGLRNDDVIIKAEIFPNYPLFENENPEVSEDYIEEKIGEIIEKINDTVPKYKRIKRYYIRKTEFEKTTTKKIKRYLDTNLNEGERL
ncbi:AMP-binding enzyme [Eubacterium brachy ATCC 33089]|nr:AMP-binding enzyme [Eubacterium brachy ATCC 33089]